MYHILAFFHIFMILRIAPPACGAHDCDMAALKRRTSLRGVSILAALVFVAILGGVAIAVENILPQSGSQSMVAATLAEQAGINDISKNTSSKDDAELKGAARCNAPIEAKKGPKEGREGVESVCVKGCQYKIYAGTPTTVNAEDLCAKETDEVTKKKCETERPCIVLQCGGNTPCTAVGGGSDKKKDELLGKAARIPEYFKNDSEIQRLLSEAKTNPTEAQAKIEKLDPYMQAAFSEAKADEQVDIQNKQAKNTETARDLIQQYGENDPQAKKLEEENRRLAEQNANLDKIDTKKLAEEQAKLPGDPSKVSCETTKTCTDDTRKDPVPPVPVPKPRPTCTGSNCSTFPPGPTKIGDPTRTGSSDSFLKGLLGGLSQAFRPTPPQPPTTPPQQCQTDPNAYSQQQQQYQYQLQQYNYQMQQYNYQQQQNQYSGYGYGSPTLPPPAMPQPCTPSTGNQCQAQPQQPPASACTAGSWRPTYSGACITNWQCIPNPNTNPPTATLSCEPKVADVGQTLAITYGCSSGTASSTSFTVTTQPGGSATTIVGNPPANTNTATYTLSCTDQGKTSGAQCSVQVSRPNIILVANPKTVAPEGISLLSWLTSGMKSCVISSPDQPDFTQRNAANTSVTGVATSSPISSQAQFLLHCETVAGSVRDATTTVSVVQ